MVGYSMANTPSRKRLLRLRWCQHPTTISFELRVFTELGDRTWWHELRLWLLWWLWLLLLLLLLWLWWLLLLLLLWSWWLLLLLLWLWLWLWWLLLFANACAHTNPILSIYNWCLWNQLLFSSYPDSDAQRIIQIKSISSLKNQRVLHSMSRHHWQGQVAD